MTHIEVTHLYAVLLLGIGFPIACLIPGDFDRWIAKLAIITLLVMAWLLP